MKFPELWQYGLSGFQAGGIKVENTFVTLLELWHITLLSLSNEIMDQIFFNFHAWVKKMPFWQFFRKADMALFNLCMKI